MSRKQSANTTHRKRLARRYREATGLSHQQALDKVIAAAEAGILPTPLDPAGMDAALTTLMSWAPAPAPAAVAPSVTAVPPGASGTNVPQASEISVAFEAKSLAYGRLVADLIEHRWPDLASALQSVRAINTRAERIAWRVRDTARLASAPGWNQEMQEQSAMQTHMMSLVQFWEHVNSGYPASESVVEELDDLIADLQEVFARRSDRSPSNLPDPAPTGGGVATLTRAPSTTKREVARLKALLRRRDGRVFIAGIVECRTALTLAEAGKVVIEDPAAITSEGGAGWIRAANEEPSADPSATTSDTNSGTDIAAAADASANSAGNSTWFVAHEGNPVTRCTGTSWRGNGRQGKKPYGPGGFNRCVKAAGHAPEDGGTDPMHVDEWGNVFRMTPKFKVVRNISNAEMAEVAREAGMAVGTSGAFESKAEAMKPNTLWMTADNEMVKVSNLYTNEGRITAQVVYPVPPRTTVRSYTLAVAGLWKPPSTAQVRKYERAWGFED